MSVSWTFLVKPLLDIFFILYADISWTPEFFHESQIMGWKMKDNSNKVAEETPVSTY